MQKVMQKDWNQGCCGKQLLQRKNDNKHQGLMLHSRRMRSVRLIYVCHLSFDGHPISCCTPAPEALTPGHRAFFWTSFSHSSPHHGVYTFWRGAGKYVTVSGFTKSFRDAHSTLNFTIYCRSCAWMTSVCLWPSV